MDSVGLCDAAGPCSEMTAAISRGAIILADGRACLISGPKFRDCCFCGVSLPTEVVQGWPWIKLRVAGLTSVEP